MAENLPEPVPSPATKAALWYGKHPGLREVVSRIPVVGPTFERMFGHLGSEWQMARAEHFFRALDRRLRKVEETLDPDTVEPSEPLFDLVTSVVANVVRTRSEEKRERFARIVAKQATEQPPWEEAEAANRLLARLTDEHIRLLLTVTEATLAVEKRGRPGVASYNPPPVLVTYLEGLKKQFTGLPPHQVRLLCAELVASGLLQDESQRFHEDSMTTFSATDLAKWFFIWTGDDSESSQPEK